MTARRNGRSTTWVRPDPGPWSRAPELLAAGLLTVGIGIRGGTYSAIALALVVLAWLVMAAALGHPDRARAILDRRPVVGTVLTLGLVAVGMLLIAVHRDLEGPAPLALVAASGLVLAGPWLPGSRWWPLLAAAAIVGAASIVAVIGDAHPTNDVWYVIQGGVDRILQGANPMTGCWPQDPDPISMCRYPYWPASSLAVLPTRVAFGDIRYADLAYIIAAAVGVAALARDRAGALLGGVVLVVGSLFVVLAWTEAPLIAGLALMLLATAQRRSWLAIVGFVIALATKQHVLLLVPLAAWWPAFGLRRTVVAGAVSLVVNLPWLLADPVAFFEDPVFFHLGQPARPDSLSLTTIALQLDFAIPFVVVAAVTAAALGLAIWRAPRTASGFALGSASVLATFHLLNKQSFFNEYALVAMLLVMAVAARVRPAPAAEVRATSR